MPQDHPGLRRNHAGHKGRARDAGFAVNAGPRRIELKNIPKFYRLRHGNPLRHVG
jgi:hypothetical protein